MPSSEWYRDFLAYFYPLFLILSLISQSFIIYIITYHTPRHLQTLKMILYNTCFFQIIHVSVCWFLQLRQVSNLVPVQIWSYGYGRYFEAFVGYSLYHVLQAATMISGISVVMTLYLKYEAARRIKPKKWKRYAAISSLLFPVFLSVCMEITLIITQSLPSDIREKYRMLNANVEDHSIVGMMDLKTLPSQVNLCVMSTSVFLLPIVGLTSRRNILKHMSNTSDRVSQAKNAQNRIFVKGLTLQTFLPLFFYVPISSVYFFAIFFHVEVLFQQYFMFLIPAFPALFDPYITLYFVTPYRNQVKIWLKIEKTSSGVTVVASLTHNY